MTTKHYSITETAKIIRAELKKAFADTKFSVRSSSYSMGCEVNISYTDGPSVEAVEAVTDRFYGKSYDGQNEVTNYHDTQYQGETVHFSGSRPHVSRHFSSDAAFNGLMGLLTAQWEPNTGSAYGDKEERQRAAYRILHRLDLRWETLDRGVAKYFAEGWKW